MSNKNNIDFLQHTDSYEESFVKETVSNKTLDFIRYFVDNDSEVDLDDITKNNKKGTLCSHANSCKLKRGGCSINTCFHTQTCEYFCQKFINKQHQKKDTTSYKNYILESNLAKREKRLRTPFFK